MHNRRFDVEAQSNPLPGSPQPHHQPASFMICPAAIVPAGMAEPGSWQRSVYHWAFQQAQACLRPSRFEQRLIPSRN